jgi:anti-sigma regulatory factor (Ser/Thr protein kinase)
LSPRLRDAEGPPPLVVGSATEARLAIAAMGSGTDRLRARLQPTPDALGVARALAERACRVWRLPHLLEDASLVASELASNAIVHAGTEFVVTVSRGADRLHLAVRDGAVAFPSPRRPASLQEGGRGLLLVQAVAVAWGAVPDDGGKVVWATVGVG